jgi:type II secretory pathway component PulC
MFTVASLTFAADKDIVKTQGIIMAIDFIKNSMVVNERLVVWDQQTLFNNEKAKPITVDQLKTKNWVYLEGVLDKDRKRVLAKKIYLLPKYIDDKQKHLYPFIQ